jgi:hypothetical protein
VPSDSHVIVVKPSKGWISLKLKELWEYRELLYFMAWRDIKVRYKQTVLGAAWAIIQPFFTMVIFSIFFGRLAKVPSDGLPYPIFAYAALVPWTFFANGLNQASNSLVGSANLIKKVYFPRLVVPISSVISGVVDFVGVAGNDALLRNLSHGQHCLVAIPLAVDSYHLSGSRALAFGIECPVPRCALYGTISDAILAVRHTHCLSQQFVVSTLANSLRHQPYGWCG